MASSVLRSLLLKKIASQCVPVKKTKISIVGTGNVGMAIAIGILNTNKADEICFFARNKDRLEGETEDLHHGFSFQQSVRITNTTDIKDTKSTDVCVFTAGAKREKGMTRLDLLKANATIVADFMKEFAKHSPQAKILMVTNPVEGMAYMAWKASGFPFNRVIGSGTSLDSNRWGFFIARRLGVSAESIDSMVIGEHGNSMVHHWSNATVGGVRLRDIDPKIGMEHANDTEGWFKLNQMTVEAGKDVITLKGATWTAIGLTSSYIVNCIVNNMNEVCPVSTNVKGLYGIKDDLYMSLPCELNFNGVCSIYTPHLEKDELTKFRKSADVLLKAQQDLDGILNQSDNE